MLPIRPNRHGLRWIGFSSAFCSSQCALPTLLGPIQFQKVCASQACIGLCFCWLLPSPLCPPSRRNSLRLWTEAFFFPALLAGYVLRYFDVRRHLPTLHTVTCLMAIYVAGIGAAEVVQQRDLLPLPESGVYLAGDTGDSSASDIILLPPNGPFSSNNSYALIGVVTFLFLSVPAKCVGNPDACMEEDPAPSRVGRGVRRSCLAVVQVGSNVSFAVVLLVDAYYQQGRRRAVRWMAVLGLGFALLLVRLALPAVFEERSDAGTFYARIAQEHQDPGALSGSPGQRRRIEQLSRCVAEQQVFHLLQERGGLDYPHNNLGAILAETGLTGFLPFVVAQVFFISAFWKLRKRVPRLDAGMEELSLHLPLLLDERPVADGCLLRRLEPLVHVCTGGLVQICHQQ